MKKPIIIGIDLGKSVGLSILDFKGNVVHLSTLRGFDTDEIVKYISSFGKPIVISSDISYSRKIKKIASSFGARVFFPQSPLTKKEKTKLTKGYYYEDIHQKDALAASLRAFKNLRKIINKLIIEFGDNFESFIEIFFKTRKNIKEIKSIYENKT